LVCELRDAQLRGTVVVRLLDDLIFQFRPRTVPDVG